VIIYTKNSKEGEMNFIAQKGVPYSQKIRVLVYAYLHVGALRKKRNGDV